LVFPQQAPARRDDLRLFLDRLHWFYFNVNLFLGDAQRRKQLTLDRVFFGGALHSARRSYRPSR
jgi:hypothetical protein